MLPTDSLWSLLKEYLVEYRASSNLNSFWNFGFLAGIFLVIQLVTGLHLSFWYTPHIDYAYDSVINIMRNVKYGWFIRYLHSNGASFFFIVIYTHILRGLYYGSYRKPRVMVWYSGVVIYVLMMGSAFLGYVLPWGQMSYWGATVITKFVTVIPYAGKFLVAWIWGGDTINNATLNRFFCLHYILPFSIAAIVVYHINVLHKVGSSNPLGFSTGTKNTIPFYPYFILKDFVALILIAIPYMFFVFFYPEYLGHPDNYVQANPMVTPAHIVPEWYFLPFYGILRSFSDKLWGVVMMFGSIVCLFLLPFVDRSRIKGNTFRSLSSKRDFFFFTFNFLFLGYLGACSPEEPFVELGLICAHIHLFYFFFALPYHSIDSLFGFISFRKLSSSSFISLYKTMFLKWASNKRTV